MSRLLALFILWSGFTVGLGASELSVTVQQVDAAIEQVTSSMDAEDPARENFLGIYRETRTLILAGQEFEKKLESYAAARANAYDDAQQIRDDLEKSGESVALVLDEKVTLAELEQMILLDKSDLSVLKKRKSDRNSQRQTEIDRPVIIRKRLAELGAALPGLEANLKQSKKAEDPSGIDKARLWLAQAQYTGNTGEKASLDEELLSQPMRLDLLAAQAEKLVQDIVVLEAHLLVTENRANVLRQGEANAVLAAAESAQADALGKHKLVREFADRNSVFSATLAKRSTAIEELRSHEIESKAEAEQVERDLNIIERKLEILGMTKTVGEILREQAVRLPSSKMTARELYSIAELIGASSLRQMELQDERRQLRDVQAYVDLLLLGQDATVVESIGDDMLALGSKRRELVIRAIDVEGTYARALSDLDFSVNRRAEAVERYQSFISERLLWVQSRDSISWSLITGLPNQLRVSFAPSRWLPILKWALHDTLGRPSTLLMLLVFTLLFYFTPRLKSQLVASGHSVGFVRTDTIADTFRALFITLVLMLKWPLLLFALAMPMQFHEQDSGLATALHVALTRTTAYFLGLEFMRNLLLPRGLVESHFRWPAERVAALLRRVVRFEKVFLFSAFLAALFMQLYPREVGGSVGTVAVIIVLVSISQFFFHMPHFVQDKMDQLLVVPKARIHSFWGTLVRGLLAWTPLGMIILVFFGYTYTAVEFSILLIKTVVLFAGMLMLHELGMRWLRLTRRKLKLKVQEELAQAQSSAEEENEFTVDEEILEHDPELLSDEGTKFLNALLLLGSVFGIAIVWAEVFPALGILDSVELWQRTDTVDGEMRLVQVTMGDLSAALIIGVLGWIAVRRLPSLFELLLRQRIDMAPASAYAMATVLKYTLTTIVVITVLSMLGGSWSQIQWAVAALSLGIGFGLQEIVANFFSGLIILFEQPIRVGDTVTVGETSGVVTKIHMRATTIRDWDRRELLVPNKEFVTGRLLNWSLTDPVTRIHIQVGVAYGTDMDKALELVRQAAISHPLILDDPAPFVTFDEFGDSCLLISLRCYLEELDKRLSTASTMRLDINRRLRAGGVSVAYPQRDVHLDARAPLDIRLVNSAADEESGAGDGVKN
ncbi:MAG: mechanosensitive ion channel domain-containing protein [Halioglobus sp.]